MEALRSFLNNLSKEEQIKFAILCGTTIGYLRKAINAKQVLGPEISVAIEQVSCGAVTRQMLHPSNFKKKWPELAWQVKTKSKKAA